MERERNLDLLRGYQVSPGRAAISDEAMPMSLLVNKDPVFVDLDGVSLCYCLIW